MYKYLNTKILFLIYLFIPVALITGPAVPDILLTLFVLIVIFFKSKIFLKLNEKWMIFFIILWIWFLIISFFAYNFSKSISDALIYIRFIFFICFSYILLKDLDEKLIKIILKLIYICCVFISLDCLYQFYNYSNEFGFGEDFFGIKPVGLYGRLSGPFDNLVPGSYISRFIFFILILFLLEKNRKKNNFSLIFFYLIMTLMVSIIYLSGERMAVATTILGLIICILFCQKLRKIILTLIALSSVFILINYNIHPHYKNYKIIESLPKHEGLTIQREINCDKNKICIKEFNSQPKFLSVLKNFDQSAYGQIYLSALHMWSDNRFTGIGLNNFTTVCNEENIYRKYNKNFGCTTHPHNIYIQILVETGLIGLIIFLILIYLILKKIIKVDHVEKKILLLSSFLTIFWPIMSTGSLLKNWNMVFLSFLISLILIIARNKKIYLK